MDAAPEAQHQSKGSGHWRNSKKVKRPLQLLLLRSTTVLSGRAGLYHCSLLASNHSLQCRVSPVEDNSVVTNIYGVRRGAVRRTPRRHSLHSKVNADLGLSKATVSSHTAYATPRTESKTAQSSSSYNMYIIHTTYATPRADHSNWVSKTKRVGAAVPYSGDNLRQQDARRLVRLMCSYIQTNTCCLCAEAG